MQITNTQVVLKSLVNIGFLNLQFNLQLTI